MIVRLEAADSADSLLVEVSDPGGRQVSVASSGENIVDAEASVSYAIKHARTSAAALLGIVRDLEVDEAELKFGLKLTGEAGLFAITKIGGEANCEVRLKWLRTPRGE